MLILLQSVIDNNGTVIPQHFAFRLREWAQNGFPELDKQSCGLGFTIGSVLTHPAFLQDPYKSAHEVWIQNNRDSASNGAVMRTSCIGIPFYFDEAKVVSNAIKAAKVTHADARSITSAVILSVLISRLLGGRSKAKEEDTKAIDKEKLRSLVNAILCSDEEDPFVTAPLPKPILSSTENQAASQYLFQNFQNFVREGGPKESWMAYQLEHPFRPSPNLELGARPLCSEAFTPSMDTFGDDDVMTRICRKVIEDYKFLLECPDNSSWIEHLEMYCFPKNLSQLRLTDPGNIGYSLKCLGYAIYCSSRAIPDRMSPGEFFKRILTELTLEGGDADTNGAVAGALLGCRLGKSNLPKEWLKGLRHEKYLREMSYKCHDLVISQLKYLRT